MTWYYGFWREQWQTAIDVPCDNVDYVRPATSHCFPIWLPLSIVVGLLDWFVWVDSQTEEHS